MSKADQLGASASFGAARPVSARRSAIGAATGAPTVGVPEPTELPVAKISQNPDNPRDELREIDGLVQSIQELGIINAITVASIKAYLKERPERAGELDEGATHLVVDGHRRLEAARRSGLKTIEVRVADERVATDESLLEAAFVANFHNDQMTDLEQAHALESLVTFYGSQSKAAKRLGISQPTISAKLSLLKLTPELQAELANGQRQVEHVRNLGKLSPEEQRTEADARAAATQERAAQSKAPRAEADGESEPARDAAADENYYAVIGEDVSGPSPQPAGEPSRSAPKKVAQPSHPAPPTESVSPAAMPWNDPQAVVLIAREHMSPEDFNIAAKLWQQQAELD